MTAKKKSASAAPTIDPAVLKRLDDIEWAYAPDDRAACVEMAERIARTGRLGSLISYSNLVSGISFHLPSVHGGKPFVIDTRHWEGLERRIVGDFLGYISAESYKRAGFMASALVVGLSTSQPSEIFFDWCVQLKLLPNNSESAVLKFWIGEVRRAADWYKANPQGFPV